MTLPGSHHDRHERRRLRRRFPRGSRRRDRRAGCPGGASAWRRRNAVPRDFAPALPQNRCVLVSAEASQPVTVRPTVNARRRTTAAVAAPFAAARGVPGRRRRLRSLPAAAVAPARTAVDRASSTEPRPTEPPHQQEPRVHAPYRRKDGCSRIGRGRQPCGRTEEFRCTTVRPGT
jgi:hypothetical protein